MHHFPSLHTETSFHTKAYKFVGWNHAIGMNGYRNPNIKAIIKILCLLGRLKKAVRCNNFYLTSRRYRREMKKV